VPTHRERRDARRAEWKAWRGGWGDRREPLVAGTEAARVTWRVKRWAAVLDQWRERAGSGRGQARN